jgi:hypothetical protein
MNENMSSPAKKKKNDPSYGNSRFWSALFVYWWFLFVDPFRIWLCLSTDAPNTPAHEHHGLIMSPRSLLNITLLTPFYLPEEVSGSTKVPSSKYVSLLFSLGVSL